ncbi:MAG: hypothetical protein H7Y20_11880, partial [Bryobacteraceae bacterium]|nr:hypothetical protein [Bryobacteraceae bacterium]
MRIFFPLASCVLALTAAAQTAPPIPDNILHEADIEYSNVGQRVAMDVLRPKEQSTEPRAAVVLVHGGG